MGCKIVIRNFMLLCYNTYKKLIIKEVCFLRNKPQLARASSFTRFLNHTQRRTTVGRTPLDEWLARHRNLYRTTRNSHNRQTSMPLVEFEPTTSAGEQPQIYALDREATGTGKQRSGAYQSLGRSWGTSRKISIHIACNMNQESNQHIWHTSL